MKYAFMTFTTPDWELERLLHFCKATGYDGFEPRLDADHAHGIEITSSGGDRAAIREQVNEFGGVELACLATSVRLLDPGPERKQMDLLKACLELARDVGCPTLRIFGGGEGSLEDNTFAEAHADRLAEALSRAAQHAASAEVRLCLETHDYWTDSRIVARVLQKVDHPSVGTNWDAMHPLRMHGISVIESYEQLKPWIFHAHMHAGKKAPGQSPPFTFLPFGHPEDEFQAFKMQKVAQEDSYTGYFSGEWLNQWTNPEEELPREIATCKKWEAEIAVG